MKKFIGFLSLVFLSLLGFAQSDFHVQGVVISSIDGKLLKNVRVAVMNDSVEAYTDNQGYFNLVVSSDSLHLVLEKPGFNTTDRWFKIDPETINEFVLVGVFSFGFNSYVPSSISGSLLNHSQSDYIVMDRVELDHVPFLFSEQDVVKALQIYPGVDFARDGFSDMVVRGGGLGQNQILLDGVPVYSLGHYQGIISNFNTSMLEDVTMFKAAFPARFGGRLASVTEISSNRGTDETTIDMEITPFLGNLNLGIPLSEKRRSSLGIGIRRSYIDLLFPTPDLQILVRDFNTHLYLELDDDNSLEISYFDLKDLSSLKFEDVDTNNNPILEYDYSLGLNNQTLSARWTRRINKRLKFDITPYYTNFINYVTLSENDLFAQLGNVKITDNDVRFRAGQIGVNSDFTLKEDKKKSVRFGWQNRIHHYNSGSLIEDSYGVDGDLIASERYGDTVLQRGIESAVYYEREQRINKKLMVNVGARGVFYNYKDYTNFYIEPRISGRYKLTENSSFKFSYARVNQFTHLYNTSGTATDYFVTYLPATSDLKPQASDLLSMGYVTKQGKHFQYLSEAYMKFLYNQPLFYNADLFSRDDMLANSLSGSGMAYGWENSIKFATKEFMFYASATLAQTTRQFEELNRGEAFSFDYDRRFTGKAGLIYSVDNIIFSVNGIYATGNPYTLPTSKYRDIQGDLILSYDEINNYRSTAHQRIDLKVEYTFSDGVQSLEGTIYNLFGYRNVNNIYSELDPDSLSTKYIAYTESSFAFFPFVSYKIKF